MACCFDDVQGESHEGYGTGYRHPRTKQVQRLFMVSQLLPSLLEPREILLGHLGCYGRF
jgi:hypothetical protein